MVAVPSGRGNDQDQRGASVEFRATRTITIWSPRANPDQRGRWKDEVCEAMRTAQRQLPAYLLRGPPTMSTVEQQLPKDATTSEKKGVLTQAMAEYQHMNTAFWDMIQPSIDFRGAYNLIDTNATLRFKVGELRDGVGLYFYVTTEIIAIDPIAEQIEAQDALAKFPKLGANDVTQVQLETHMHGLYRAFVKVEGNDQQYGAFRTRLLASLPFQ